VLGIINEFTNGLCCEEPTQDRHYLSMVPARRVTLPRIVEV
jgi:hypothetical protein